MSKELQLVEKVRADVESEGAVPTDYAEDFSNFVFDGGNLYARRAVRKLCEGTPLHPNDEVVEAIIDSYVTGVVEPVRLEDADDVRARRESLVAFLRQFKDELEKSPAYQD